MFSAIQKPNQENCQRRADDEGLNHARRAVVEGPNQIVCAVGKQDDKHDGGRFTRGFVTASLIFCVGPMTILGSIQDGLVGDYNLLAIKSTLDGFAALAFSSTLGIGVAFSALTVFVFQGGISLMAILLGGALGTVSRETPWVIEMTATGGVLIMGISLVLLELKQVRLGNLLPAIFIAPAIVAVLGALKLM